MDILDGRVVKKYVINNLKDKLSVVSKRLCFVVIYVDNNDVSDVYINSKKSIAKELRYNLIVVKMDKDAITDDLVCVIDKYNEDDDVDGIMIELPIPSSIDYDFLRNRIRPDKDIEGVTDINIGKMITFNDGIVSCTAMAVMELLKFYNIDVSGKNVVIVGRSNLVGKPLFNLFIKEDATVTMCHSKTTDLSFYTRNADILVVCVGISNFITGDMVKKDSVVIDVGTNYVDGKLCGDVDFLDVKDIVKSITPVPFGVGQVTSACLGVNIYKCYLSKRI